MNGEAEGKAPVRARVQYLGKVQSPYFSCCSNSSRWVGALSRGEVFTAGVLLAALTLAERVKGESAVSQQSVHSA